jgi:hypothetical protein
MAPIAHTAFLLKILSLLIKGDIFLALWRARVMVVS